MWTLSIVISALSLLVSAGVATWNVFDRFLNRAEERRRRLPILTSSISCVQGNIDGLPGAGQDLDGNSLRFTFAVETTNSGVNTAERIETEVLFAPDLEQPGPVPRNSPAWWISFANPLPEGGTSKHFESYILQVMPRRWIRIEHRFTDAQTGKRSACRCGFIWEGTADGRVLDMSVAQMDKLSAYLDGLSDQQLAEFFYWQPKRPSLPDVDSTRKLPSPDPLEG